MDYVPISEKKKVADSAQLKEGESRQRSEKGVLKENHHFKASDTQKLTHVVQLQVALWCMTACSWFRTQRP